MSYRQTGADALKNQFFADKRDLFKYDLLLHVMGSAAGIRRLTYVPMLTPDDGSGDGRLKHYRRGSADERLYRFLTRCRDRGTFDVRLLRGFFHGAPFTYTPYMDDSYFTHEGRDAYFAGIPSRALVRALVFLDPDNGLEVPSYRPANGRKYLLYTEVADLLSRMGEGAVLMIYQHIPRTERSRYFRHICDRLRREAGAAGPMCVSDNQVAFFFLCKTAERCSAVGESLARYASARGCIFYGPE